jgi:methionyl aminopeptidase
MASDNLLKSAALLNDLLLYLRGKAKAGVALQFLEDEAAKFLRMHEAKSSFLGYYGYPANTCLSVNDCVVHGFPDDTILKDGDVLKIDAGVKYK